MLKKLLILVCSVLLTSNVVYGIPVDEILDGTPADATNYPYVARIEYDGDILCTGTLIGERHILTAAHCFYGEDGQREVGDSDVTVRLGNQTFSSSKVFIHSSYRAGDSACVEGEMDAAIIALSSSATGISVIPLYSGMVPVGSSVLLAGFGTQGTGAGGEDGTVPAVGTINVGTTSIEGYGSNFGESNFNSLYANWQFQSGESNTGSGDSGGPAFFDVNGQRFLSSITCGGDGNAGHGTFSFNTRSDLIKPWADAIITSSPISSIKVKKGELVFNGDFDTDYFYVVGSVNVGTGFIPKNQKITAQVGNFSKTFKLRADGTVASEYEYLDLKGSMKKGAFKKPTVNFELVLSSNKFLNELEALGIPIREDATSGQTITIPMTISLNGGSVSSTLSLTLKGQKWRGK